MHLRKLLFLFILFPFQTTFAKQKQLKAGTWYGSFKLAENSFLPFLFEIHKTKKEKEIYIINGRERILLNNFKSKGDSLFIEFPAFASEFKLLVKNKKELSGAWFNYAKKGNYNLPFIAIYGKNERYPNTKSTLNVTGKWKVVFDYKDVPETAIGIFKSDVSSMKTGLPSSNRVTGTFLTETGDYRFLEGATIKDSLYLSTFDGSHAFLFRAEFVSDTLWGEFRSGNHYKTEWYAFKNENVTIGNPDSLTYLINKDPVEFSLTNLNGEKYTYPNKETQGKVTIIQIMGTWCPNCLDESQYLKTLKEKHKDKLEIIAITFETQKTQETKIEKVKAYKKNLGLDYTFLLGGDACKSCATRMFPMLNEIISFPTIMIIDKAGEIRKIHTGFNGPGTGEYYQSFVSKTNSFINELIKE